MALTDKLTAIADAIRSKTGTSESLTLDAMVTAIDGISVSGGDEASVLDSFIDRSITEISSNVTTVGDYSFCNCNSLTTANFPLATSLGSYAFKGCNSLTTTNFPLVTRLGSYAFNGCKLLTTANFPLVTSLEMSTYEECWDLETANFPLVTSIGHSCFKSALALEMVNFPLATKISNYGFRACYALKTVKFPLVTTIATYGFQSCQKLEKADFSNLTSMQNSVFDGCSVLKALIIRSETVCTITSTNVFTSCNCFNKTKDGFIYVPSALVDSYKSATNWSTYATQFRALEDYTVDGTTTGELDESKI